MKLVIQVPCLDEAEHLPHALAALPRHVEGFTCVEWLVIDDGSRDATVEVARAHGVDHIVRLRQHRGLAAAFEAGLDAGLKLGADVIVNTDADDQYRADDIPNLLRPILRGEADLVIGDRGVASVPAFSVAKRRLQELGSWAVRVASGTDVPDAASGFRAYTREAALRLTVVDRYTYTIESVIQAGRSQSAVAHVPVGTNPSRRPSRLSSSTGSYVRRNGFAIVRVFAAYEPIRFFGLVALVLAASSLVAFSPFLYDWLINGDRSGHLQSILLGSILAGAAVQAVVLAVVGDLVAAHRVISQRTLERVRRLELALGVEPSNYETGAERPGRVVSRPPDPTAAGVASRGAGRPTTRTGPLPSSRSPMGRGVNVAPSSAPGVPAESLPSHETPAPS